MWKVYAAVVAVALWGACLVAWGVWQRHDDALIRDAAPCHVGTTRHCLLSVSYRVADRYISQPPLRANRIYNVDLSTDGRKTTNVEVDKDAYTQVLTGQLVKTDSVDGVVVALRLGGHDWPNRIELRSKWWEPAVVGAVLLALAGIGGLGAAWLRSATA